MTLISIVTSAAVKNHMADINFAIVRRAERWTDKRQRIGEEGDQKD